MAYGVICEIHFPRDGSGTGTVRIVENPPPAHRGRSTDVNYYDVTHFSTLGEARANLEQLRRSYASYPGIRFISL